jgi:hypothetical protein
MEKMLNKECCNLYSSPYISRMIQSRRMRLTEHVAHMGEKRNAYRILVGKPEGRRPLGRCKWILEKLDDVVWTGFIWLRIGTSGGVL